MSSDDDYRFHDAGGDTNGVETSQEDATKMLLDALHRLDDVYVNDLARKEQALSRALERIKGDEQCLVHALAAASSISAASPNRLLQQQRSEDAAARLQQALMNADDDDDSSCSNGE